jgi:hypothetical protein
METQHDLSRSIDAHEEMHNLFVLALLSSHPDPETVRGQFRTLLNGLAATHSRYVFGDDFVVSVRRSILRFDRMLSMVLTARNAVEVAAAEAETAAVAEVAVSTDSVAEVEPLATAGQAALDAAVAPPPEPAPAALEPEPRAT